MTNQVDIIKLPGDRRNHPKTGISGKTHKCTQKAPAHQGGRSNIREENIMEVFNRKGSFTRILILSGLLLAILAGLVGLSPRSVQATGELLQGPPTLSPENRPGESPPAGPERVTPPEGEEAPGSGQGAAIAWFPGIIYVAATGLLLVAILAGMLYALYSSRR